MPITSSLQGGIAAPNSLESAAAVAVKRSIAPAWDFDLSRQMYALNGAAIDNKFLTDSPLEYRYAGPPTQVANSFNSKLVNQNNICEYFIDYDYSQNTQVQNGFTYSEDYENAAWVKSGVSVLPDVALAPNGKQTASKIIPALGALQPKLHQDALAFAFKTPEFNAQGFQTFSTYVKDDGSGIVGLFWNDAAEENSLSKGYYFNLQTGTVKNHLNEFEFGATTKDSDFVPCIKHVGDGWFLISISVGNMNGDITAPIRLVPTIVDYSTGDGKKGFFLWGSQITTTNKVLPYTKTEAAAIDPAYGPPPFYPKKPRFEFDPITGESLGALFETGKTNWMRNTESFSNTLSTGGAAAGWDTNSMGYTLGNEAFAPDLTKSAMLVRPAEFLTEHFIKGRADGDSGTQAASAISPGGSTIKSSIFVKKRDFDKVRFKSEIVFDSDLSPGDISNVFAEFTFSTKGFVAVSNTANASITKLIVEEYAGGWFRLGLVVFYDNAQYTNFVATEASMSLYLGDAAFTPTQQQRNHSGVFVWGANMEIGGGSKDTLLSYVSNEAATTTFQPQSLSSQDSALLNFAEQTIVVDFNLKDQTTNLAGAIVTGVTHKLQYDTFGPDDSLVLDFDNDGSQIVITSPEAPLAILGQDTKLAIVTKSVNENTDSVYIDGTFVASGESYSATSSTAGLGSIYNRIEFMPLYAIGSGHIKSIALYAYALTADEVKVL